MSEETFIKWLGDAPCLLLVDRMDFLCPFTSRDRADSIAGREVGEFLRRNFLSRRNRYLEVSSCEISIAERLPVSMERTMSRSVLIRPLSEIVR